MHKCEQAGEKRVDREKQRAVHKTYWDTKRQKHDQVMLTG